MIVRMKEILLFTLASSVNETIYRLGELGVVDIAEVTKPAGRSIEWRTKLVENTESAINILKNHSKPESLPDVRQRYHSRDPKRLTDRVLQSGHIRKECQKRLEELNQQLDWYETWGENIDISDFDFLRENGIYIRLYKIDKNQVRELSNEHCLVEFPGQDGKVPVALFTRDEYEKLIVKEEEVPELPLEKVKEQIKRKERQLREVEIYLEDQSQNIGLLEEYHNLVTDYLNIEETLGGMGDIEGTVKYLRGYIPRDKVEEFKSVAKEQNWGYTVSEPTDPDEVPVYVKNPKWISIINPVMKFIDIVPGYKEVDVSIYFLVAFALFFAMLVGDAGYGAIFLIITFFLRKKLDPQMRFLIYVLSGATIAWGVMSGTYFGSESIAAIPFLNNLIVEDISSFGVDNINFMMHLSFLIGAIHLTIAHGIRIVQFINSIRLLSEIGWIAFIWGLFFVAELLVLGKEMPDWTIWLFVAGGVLVTFFSMEGKTFFKSMLASLGNLPLSLINGFSDIVSYVRLFAVGLATATVAASFNDMILPTGFEGMSFIGLILAAVALFVGHGLNIVLALMAVMVHGIRLNMLEFAGHVGVQFSGEAYKPFRLLSDGHEYTNSPEGKELQTEH